MIKYQDIGSLIHAHDRLSDIESMRRDIRTKKAYLRIYVRGEDARGRLEEEVDVEGGAGGVFAALDAYLLHHAKILDKELRDAGIEPSVTIAEPWAS